MPKAQTTKLKPAQDRPRGRKPGVPQANTLGLLTTGKVQPRRGAQEILVQESQAGGVWLLLKGTKPDLYEHIELDPAEAVSLAAAIERAAHIAHQRAKGT